MFFRFQRSRIIHRGKIFDIRTFTHLRYGRTVERFGEQILHSHVWILFLGRLRFTFMMCLDHWFREPVYNLFHLFVVTSRILQTSQASTLVTTGQDEVCPGLCERQSMQSTRDAPLGAERGKHWVAEKCCHHEMHLVGWAKYEGRNANSSDNNNNNDIEHWTINVSWFQRIFVTYWWFDSGAEFSPSHSCNSQKCRWRVGVCLEDPLPESLKHRNFQCDFLILYLLATYVKWEGCQEMCGLCCAKCKYSMTCENDWRDRYIQGKNGFWLQYVVTVYRFNAQISTRRYMAWFVPFVFKIAPTPHLPQCRKVRSFWSLWRGAWSKKPAMFLSSYRNRAAEAPHTPLQRRSEGLVQGNNIRFFLIWGGCSWYTVYKFFFWGGFSTARWIPMKCIVHNFRLAAYCRACAVVLLKTSNQDQTSELCWTPPTPLEKRAADPF